MEQETLIYIEENDKKEARILTQSFANSETKSRAYINALGAELGMKYLALENINSSKTYNLHSIHKILEELDISDIMLSNIHIDVRVVFDENLIFIPKSHFEYDILPDIYLVLNLSEDHAHAKFLGFFEPKLINKNNQNNDYYFIEKEKLTSPLNLKDFIENFKGNTTHSLSASENQNAEVLMVSLMDQNVSRDEMKELLNYLTKSADLRDKFIEFENFELLSYKALHTPDIEIPKDVEEETTIDATLDDLDNSDSSEMFSSEDDAEEASDNEESSQEQQEDEQEQPFEETQDFQEETAESENTVPEENSSDMIGDLGELGGLDGLEGLDALDGLGEADTIENSPEALENPADATPEASSSPAENEVSKSTASDMLTGLAEFTAEATAAGGAVAAAGAAAAAAGATSASIELSAAESLTEAGLDMLAGSVDALASDNTQNIQETQNNAAELSFDEINLEDLSNVSDLEALSEAEPAVQAAQPSEASSEDVQDFDTIEQTEIQQPVENPGESEMEVLDISNVNAVPNNLDANISETVEFNNIEQPETEPCSNETNGEATAPTVTLDSIDSFNGLEPLSPDDMTFPDNSVDIENLSTAPIDTSMGPVMPPLNDANAFDPFAPVDLDSLSLTADMPQNNGADIQKHNEELASSLTNEVGSSLDDIPDFGSELGLGGMDGLDNIPDINGSIQTAAAPAAPVTPKPATVPQTPPAASAPANNDELSGISDIPDLAALDSLTADDIVDMPAEEQQPVEPADFLQTEPEEATTAPQSATPQDFSVDDLSSVDAIPDENPEFSAIAGLDELDAGAPEQSSAVPDNINIPPAASQEDGDLNMLFEDNNETLANNQQLQTLESPFLNRAPKQKNNLKSILVTIILAGAMLGGTFFVFTMKNKNGASELEALSQTEPEAELPAAPAEAQTGDAAAPANPAAPDNSDILANTPEVETIPAAQQEPKNTKQEAKPATTNTKNAKPVNPAGTYMSVKKLSWEVPDFLSYSNNMRRYLQTAGKSIKLSLSSDLLLTNEYAYSNQVKVSMKLSNDGTLKDIQIVKSSGSDQINDIVLQTVKDTLNVIKPATGEVPTPEFKLGLTINF